MKWISKTKACLVCVLEKRYRKQRFWKHKEYQKVFFGNIGFGNIENTKNGASLFTKQVFSFFKNKKLFLKVGAKQVLRIFCPNNNLRD